MTFNYELEKLDSKYSARLRVDTDIFLVKLRYNGASTQSIFGELLTTLDELTAELKSGLDPENDRIGLSLEHPDLIAKSIDVPLQRPKNLTGQLVFTHIGKAVQSQHTLLLDGKMRLTVTVARGVHGSGRLTLANAKNFNDYFKRKRGIVQIDNKDKLCLPRAIVVGRAYIQHFEEKSVSKHEYYCIAGIKKSQVDRQGELAKDLCARAGIRVEEYNNAGKTFGMEEVKVFARLLAPKYGIAVHNSLTANSKVFETPTSEDHKIVSWINLLNLSDHFNPITIAVGIFWNALLV